MIHHSGGLDFWALNDIAGPSRNASQGRSGRYDGVHWAYALRSFTRSRVVLHYDLRLQKLLGGILRSGKGISK